MKEIGSSPLGWMWPTGRVVLAVLFLVSGGLKIAFHGPIAGAIASKGLPAADLLAWSAAVFEIGGAVALIAGVRLVEVALALAGWCLVTALLFHQFWAATGLEQQNQFSNFLKNVALIGAFLIVASEAGRRSLPIPQRADA